LHPEKLGNKIDFSNTTERARDVRHLLQPLREVWIKVGLEKLESHEGVVVKVLLDSRATCLFTHMWKREAKRKEERSKEGGKR